MSEIPECLMTESIIKIFDKFFGKYNGGEEISMIKINWFKEIINASNYGTYIPTNVSLSMIISNKKSPFCLSLSDAAANVIMT